MENEMNKSTGSETRRTIEMVIVSTLLLGFMIGFLVFVKKAFKYWRKDLIEISSSSKLSSDPHHSITLFNMSDYHYKPSMYLMLASIVVAVFIVSYLMSKYFSVFRFEGNHRDSTIQMSFLLTFLISAAPIAILWSLVGEKVSLDYQNEVNTASLSSWSESRYGVSLDEEQANDLLPEDGYLDNRDFKNGTGSDFETKLSDGRIVKLSPTGKPYTYNLVEVKSNMEELPLKVH